MIFIALLMIKAGDNVSELLAGVARPATAAELAGLYALLHGRGLLPDTVAPAVVLVEAPGTASLAPDLSGRLVPYGVRVVATTAPEPAAPPRTTFLLGGGLHGWCLGSGAAGTGEEETALISAAVVDSRLRTWSAATREAPEPTGLHPPGSDSTGVVQFNDGTELVAKIGESEMIRAETAFIARSNAEVSGSGGDPLFPHLHGVHLEGRQGVSLMEAAEPAGLEARLFRDEDRTELGPDAPGLLAPYLEQLAGWYRRTAAGREPTCGDYLYRERFHVLRAHPEFLATFRTCFGDRDLDALLAEDLLLPDGGRIPGYTACVRWLDEHAADLLPRTGSRVHGDIYPTNMLRRPHGGPVFIDPRTVWEQRERPDAGYGDPVFDLATLLHGLLPMPAILQACRRGRPQDLFGDGFDPARPHDLGALRLPLAFSPALRAMESRLIEVAPGGEPEHRVRCRLYIGAACSLAGWLKYRKTLRTPYAWLATYAYTVWYLWRARNVHERHLPLEESL